MPEECPLGKLSESQPRAALVEVGPDPAEQLLEQPR